MKPLYIFDLDGTLSLLQHRRHFVRPPSEDCITCGGRNRKSCPDCADLDAGWKPNWDAFHAACEFDKPNDPVIRIFEALSWGNELWIWSGRVDSVKAQTQMWLNACVDAPYEQLKMRPHGYYVPDDKLKAAWYADMSGNDKRRLVAVFDDRTRMVQMWRDIGVTCLQVAPGDF